MNTSNRRTEIKIIRIDEPVSIKYEDKGPEVIDRKKDFGLEIFPL